MRELSWFQPGKGATAEDVEKVERYVGRQFPDDYREFLIKYAGSYNPDECEFTVTTSGSQPWISNFGVLLSTYQDDVDSIVCTYDGLRDQLPDGIVPIIGDGGGDYVGLDYRHGDPPSISYFSHECDGPDAVVSLAASLSVFLDMLWVADDAE
jgi:cell wall assembly regulator SMI1